MGPNFFSAGDGHTEELLALFYPGVGTVTEVDTDPKGGLYSLWFIVFMPLQSLAPGNRWLGGVSSKDYKVISKIKMRGMKQNNNWRIEFYYG